LEEKMSTPGLTALEAQVVALEGAVASLQQNNATLIADNANQVTALNSTISNLQAELTTANNTIAALQVELTNAQTSSEDSAVQGQANAIEGQVGLINTPSSTGG
jgi:chromosome segregation ATPase